MRITCPHCGTRDHVEFAYGGDAARAYPGLDCTESGPWYEYVFLRDNPRGPHVEYWQHIHGCRRWLKVQRDTTTHDIISVEDAANASMPLPDDADE